MVYIPIVTPLRHFIQTPFGPMVNIFKIYYYICCTSMHFLCVYFSPNVCVIVIVYLPFKMLFWLCQCLFNLFVQFCKAQLLSLLLWCQSIFVYFTFRAKHTNSLMQQTFCTSNYQSFVGTPRHTIFTQGPEGPFRAPRDALFLLKKPNLKNVLAPKLNARSRPAWAWHSQCPGINYPCRLRPVR